MAFSFLTQEIAMDLGTANTVIFQNDQIVLDEPSIVAIDNNTGKALALGQKAKLMQERENPGIKTVRPMKDGVIADFNAAEMMIRGFIKQVNSKRRSLFTPNIKMVVGIPAPIRLPLPAAIIITYFFLSIILWLSEANLIKLFHII